MIKAFNEDLSFGMILSNGLPSTSHALVAIAPGHCFIQCSMRRMVTIAHLQKLFGLSSI